MNTDIFEFIHKTRFEDLPQNVTEMAERCSLDLLGVAAAGRRTPLSEIVTNHSINFFAAGDAISDILFAGKTASPVGAALAGGMTIDSFDAHDGHRLTKGHAGAAVLPALLAFASSMKNSGHSISGQEFLTALTIGYEVSLRAGIVLHATACDYHTSGAWNSIGAAAIGARLLKLDESETRHALGIAEYHGPRSQMMRCIDHPTMLKDGSGWGAMSGVSAAYLAKAGFTGAPAITLEGDDVQAYWANLGVEWEILAQYFKPYPVCRWAQPAVQAVSDMMSLRALDHSTIAKIEIRTFHEALRLAGHNPQTTEQAQYAIAYPIAALIVKGKLGAEQLSTESLNDVDIVALSGKIELSETAEYNSRFPAERWADVTITTLTGDIFDSPATCPLGDPENPLTDDHIRLKFRQLCSESLDSDAIDRLEEIVCGLRVGSQSADDLLDVVRRYA